jgi:hypothetical protein
MLLHYEVKSMDEEKTIKIKALLYWYILGVPLCLIIVSIILFMVDFPILIGFAFLAIFMYAGIVSILIIFTNAILKIK